MSKIDINRKDFYYHGMPDKEKITKKRLIQISEMGMEEVGVAQFGVEGVMSGLYIEKVWSYSDKDWDSYIEWAQGVIDKKTKL